MPKLIFSALKASHGDAIIVTSEKANIVIDGGPHGVYHSVLRDAVVALPSRPGEVPVIDLMMVSHIDDDHIIGVKELATELQHNPFAEIGNVWRNSFADEFILGEIADRARPASLSAHGLPEYLRGLVAEAGGGESALAGIASARALDDVLLPPIAVNAGFSDKVILRESSAGPQAIGDLTFEVLGPTRKELEDLKERWIKDLPKILEREAKAQEAALAAVRLDRSAANLASIVTILKAGDCRILLTGDARTDHILEWLGEAGHLDAGRLHFNIIKVPHHGSKRNNTKDFYKNVTADHYVISGNGGHGNPDPGVIEMICNSRVGEEFTIHLTYSPYDIADHRTYRNKGKSDLLHSLMGRAEIGNVVRFPEPDDQSLEIVLDY